MHKPKHLVSVLALVCLFSWTLSLQAQDENKTIYGNFMLGYRIVDTDGAMDKYKEDINLDEGVRLLNFNLSLRPNETMKNVFDSMDINIYNFGGDPFETLNLSMQKFGKYKVQFGRKKSTYYYADPYMDGHFDLHAFNFDRVSNNALIKIFINDYIDVYANYDSYNKTGDSVTTFDINRIEFEFDKPVEENLREVAVGADLHIPGYSFSYEYRNMDYDTTNSLFLPGLADGGPGARYPSSLDFFTVNQPYDLDQQTNLFKATARPFSILTLSGAVQLTKQDMALAYSEGAKGVDFFGNGFNYGVDGSGDFTRDIKLYDADASLVLFNNLALIGGFRFSEFKQSGSLSVDGEQESMALGFETTGIEGGIQYQFSSKAALTLGYRFEERKFIEGASTLNYEDDTTRNGYFGNLALNPSRMFGLTFDYQRGTYDDVYTLASPTAFNRLRATAKFQKNDFFASASFMNKNIENDFLSLWESSRNQLNLRAGYHTDQFKISGGLATINVETEGNRDIVYPPAWSGGPGSFPWTIAYKGDSTIFDGSIAYIANEFWTVGAYFSSYSNDGTWEVSRTMIKAYLEHTFTNGLVGQIGFRNVNFDETSETDYSANIFELAFGYRWK